MASWCYPLLQVSELRSISLTDTKMISLGIVKTFFLLLYFLVAGYTRLGKNLKDIPNFVWGLITFKRNISKEIKPKNNNGNVTFTSNA